MNISSHAFVASRFFEHYTGNLQSFWDYYFTGVGTCRPFPKTATSYAYYSVPAPSPTAISVIEFPILPYQVSDNTDPKTFVLLLY